VFRIKQLEKDLFYYKKSSRELKRRMKELVADSPESEYRHRECKIAIL